jgi:hypothetical protein
MNSIVLAAVLLAGAPDSTLSDDWRQAAAAEQTRIATTESDVLAAEEQLIQSLQESIRLTNQQPDSDLMTVATLKELVPRLKRRAEILVQDHAQFVAAGREYELALAEAPAVFEKVAEQFYHFADEEHFDSIRSQYLSTSELFRQLGVRFQARRETFAGNLQAVADNGPFVEHTALYLQRLDAALQTVPDESLDPGPLLRATADYVHLYESLEHALRNFHLELATPAAVSPKVRSALWKGGPIPPTILANVAPPSAANAGWPTTEGNHPQESAPAESTDHSMILAGRAGNRAAAPSPFVVTRSVEENRHGPFRQLSYANDRELSLAAVAAEPPPAPVAPPLAPPAPALVEQVQSVRVRRLLSPLLESRVSLTEIRDAGALEYSATGVAAMGNYLNQHGYALDTQRVADRVTIGKVQVTICSLGETLVALDLFTP